MRFLRTNLQTSAVFGKSSFRGSIRNVLRFWSSNQKPAGAHTGYPKAVASAYAVQSVGLLETSLDSLDRAVVVMVEVGNETLFLHVTNLLT